jgi:Na+/alanine symporter
VKGMVVLLAVSARGPGASFWRWIFWSAELGLRLQA